jgi:hypothetical protein
VASALPSTATNKVLKRTLVQDKYRFDRVGADILYVRDRGAPAYRLFSASDEAALRSGLDAAGRSRFWDL